MNTTELKKILDEHKVYIESFHECGSKANLYGANLRGANLYGADLREANLREANLREADLREADLYGANLREADLRGANLYGANLREADLREANLYGANLFGADLTDRTFIITGEKYFISIANSESVRAGCQTHTIEEWRKFTKAQIADMGGRSALKFYPHFLDIIDFYTGAGERPEWLKEKDTETEAA